MSNVARSSFFNFSANGIRVLLSFATTVLLARSLGANDFGEINLIIGYTMFLHYLWAMGFDHTLAFYIPTFGVEQRPWLAREALRVALAVSTVAALGFIVLGLLLLPPVLQSHGLGHFVLPGLILGGQNWFSAMGAILSGYLRGARDFQALILKDQIIFPGAHLVLTVIVICLFHGGIFAYSIVFAAANLAALIYAGWAVRSSLPARETAEKRREHRTRRAWVGYSIPIALTGAIESLLPWGTVIALGWYLPAASVGQFAVCFRVSVFIQFLLLAVGPIFSPFLAEHFQRKEMNRFRELYHSVNFLCGAWSLVLATVFFVSGDLILRLFGRDYSGATILLGVLLLANLLEGAFGAIKQSLIMTGNSRVNLVNICVAIVVNVIVCLVLIPRFGVLGAGFANFVSYLVMNSLRGFEFYIKFGIGPFNRVQSLYLAVATSCLGALCLWSYEGNLSTWSRASLSAIVLILSGGAALTRLPHLRGQTSAV
jgi:O-antigen/teichoic acid export membrane protein